MDSDTTHSSKTVKNNLQLCYFCHKLFQQGKRVLCLLHLQGNFVPAAFLFPVHTHFPSFKYSTLLIGKSIFCIPKAGVWIFLKDKLGRFLVNVTCMLCTIIKGKNLLVWSNTCSAVENALLITIFSLLCKN